MINLFYKLKKRGEEIEGSVSRKTCQESVRALIWIPSVFINHEPEWQPSTPIIPEPRDPLE